MLRRLRTFLRLDRPQRRQLLEAAVCFHTARAVLWVVPRRSLSTVLRPAVSERRGADSELAYAVGRSVQWASRRHPDSCLAEALAARFMLRRRGLAPSLTLGVREDEGGALRFHAWLHLGDIVVTGREGHRWFQPLSTLADRGKA